jgi:hypothetical protein
MWQRSFNVQSCLRTHQCLSTLCSAHQLLIVASARATFACPCSLIALFLIWPSRSPAAVSTDSLKVPRIASPAPLIPLRTSLTSPTASCVLFCVLSAMAVSLQVRIQVSRFETGQSVDQQVIKKLGLIAEHALKKTEPTWTRKTNLASASGAIARYSYPERMRSQGSQSKLEAGYALFAFKLLQWDWPLAPTTFPCKSRHPLSRWTGL